MTALRGLSSLEHRDRQRRRRNIAPAIQGVGTVEAKVAVQVGSRITGRLVAVPVDQGNVRRAQSTLDDLVAGSRPAEIEQLRERANSARATGGSWKCATGS